MTWRDLWDPVAGVLGGGGIGGCSDFLLPIIDRTVAADKLAGARAGRPLLLSALGDDAVVLGAVALARIHAGRDPFDEQYHVRPTYQEVIDAGQGRGGAELARRVEEYFGAPQDIEWAFVGGQLFLSSGGARSPPCRTRCQ